tara:strand:- start:24 stop:311 length:288 start_codon:yes stop_codon:yes gene_type:complete
LKLARPAADLPPSAQIESLIDAEGRLAVRVTPGARTESLGVSEGTLQAKVRAKPQDGAANAAVMRLVAKALGVPPSRVELLRGDSSREKLLKILA